MQLEAEKRNSYPTPFKAPVPRLMPAQLPSWRISGKRLLECWQGAWCNRPRSVHCGTGPGAQLSWCRFLHGSPV